jgi:hypothetical protein
MFDLAQKLSPDGLFRSISLVVQDNAASEYAFLSAFFGQSGPGRPRASAATANGSANASSDASWDVLSSAGTEDEADTSSVIGSDVTASATASADKIRRSLVDNVWRQVFDGSLEYAKVRASLCALYRKTRLRPQSFIHVLLDPPPPPVSVLAMIRLNDAIHVSAACPAAAFDGYLTGVRLSLWPLFQRGIDAQAESLRRIAASGSSGVFKTAGSTTAKEAAVSAALRQYAALFTAVVALSEDADDEMVFSRCAPRLLCPLSNG